MNGNQTISLEDNEVKQLAAQRATNMSRAARWDLDVAVFLFAILIIIVVLLYQGIAIEIVSPVAVFGLTMVWLIGWRRGKHLYRRFYEEEIFRLEKENKKKVERLIGEILQETIEDKVQKALRERWK